MGWFRSSRDPGADATPAVEDRLATIGPGVPGRCPACDGLGYIDSIDIGHRFQIQHCKDCGHRWEYLFDAEGRVVGLTELDQAGQPVARTRVRSRPAPAPSPAPPPEDAPQRVPVLVEQVDPPVGSGVDVIDLRDAVAEPSVDEPAVDEPAAADQMSPAEWLRHALGR